MGTNDTGGVIDAVRRIIERWTITRTNLIEDAHAGDTVIYVKSTRRWQVGDVFVIADNDENMENEITIAAILSPTAIQIVSPLKWSWPVSTGGNLLKTQFGMLVKSVQFGDPDVIVDLPAITVHCPNKSSEWMTLRGSKEHFEIEITVYVSAASLEEGDRFLLQMLDTIQYALKRNFYPLLNDFKTTPLKKDIVSGDTYIQVDDNSILSPFSEIIIEDQYNIQVCSVLSCTGSNIVQLAESVNFDFLAADTTVIRPNRLPFASWPTGINYGKVYKGTLLKAGTISYYVDVFEQQPDAGFSDPQLQ
jgi:hypothetical protein